MGSSSYSSAIAITIVVGAIRMMNFIPLLWAIVIGLEWTIVYFKFASAHHLVLVVIDSYLSVPI